MSRDQGGSRGAGRLARSERCQPLCPLMDLLPVFVCASGLGAMRGEGGGGHFCNRSFTGHGLADLPCTCTQGASTAKR